MCLCVCTTNASKKRTSEAAEQPSKRVKTVNAAAGESSRAATGSGDEVLGYHPLHDETGSQEPLDARTMLHRELRGDV